VLLEETLGYWVEVFHRPDALNETRNQITLFRNPYDSILSALEKHFQDVHPSLQPFDINNEDEVRHNIKNYVRLYNIYLDDYKKDHIYPVTYEYLRNDPIDFVTSVANFFNLEIANKNISEAKVLQIIDEKRLRLEHIRKRLIPVKEKESLKKFLTSNDSLKQVYERYNEHKEFFINVNTN
jgi:hypothetical protein